MFQGYVGKFLDLRMGSTTHSCKKVAGLFVDDKLGDQLRSVILYVPGSKLPLFPYNRDGHQPNSRGLYIYIYPL